MRNAFDFTPFARSSIGFDHLFDLLNDPQLTEDQGGYPPYDIVRTSQDTYRIAVAVAVSLGSTATATAALSALPPLGSCAASAVAGSPVVVTSPELSGPGPLSNVGVMVAPGTCVILLFATLIAVPVPGNIAS